LCKCSNITILTDESLYKLVFISYKEIAKKLGKTIPN